MYPDKDGTPHYGGDPAYAEEWEERCLLGFMACTKEETRKAFAPKVTNALFDWAWTLTHRDKEISVARVTELINHDERGPERAIKELIRVVRKACDKTAPLQKHKAFQEFSRKGYCRQGEPIGDYIQRRAGAYDRLVDLTASKTTVSEDLRSFFLLDMAGISDEQHKRYLGQANNEYVGEDIVKAMLIQVDQSTDVQRPRSSASRSSHKFNWKRAFAVDEGNDASEDGGGDDHVSPPSASDAAEESETLVADLEEFEDAIEAMEISDGQDHEVDAFANETQKVANKISKFGRKHPGTSQYALKRQAVQHRKTNRGFIPNQGFKQNKMSVDLDGNFFSSLNSCSRSLLMSSGKPNLGTASKRDTGPEIPIVQSNRTISLAKAR